MQEISVTDLKSLQQDTIQMIDVRERYEYEMGNIDAMNMPMDTVLKSIKKINPNKKVILYCQTGRRSAAVVYMLHKKHNLDNTYSLKGGYQAYLDLTSKEKII